MTTLGRRQLLTGALGLVAVSCASPAGVARPRQIAIAYHLGPQRWLYDPFREAMAARGYVEGRDVTYDELDPQSDPARLDALVIVAVRKPVDLIVGATTVATRACLRATRTIPIIMPNMADPVADGFVASFARPGGNVTGITQLAPNLQPKRVGYLLEATPYAKRVAVVTNSTNPSIPAVFSEAAAVLHDAGVEVLTLDVATEADVNAALARAEGAGADALLTLGEPFITAMNKRWIDFAERERIPALGPHAQFVDDGGLMSFGPTFPALWRQATGFVDRVFKGAMPADLPVQLPDGIELVLNLQAAQRIGLTFPSSLLAHADRVAR